MKVLYLGHFFENSSWTKVAIEHVKALNLYCETVWRPITINKNIFPQEINQYYGSLNNIDVVIQHILPPFMQKGKKKCIGFFEQESDSIKYCGWKEKLDSLDQVWVPNKKYQLKNFKLIRHCTDISKYNIDYEKPYIPILQDKFVFYTIAEFNRRKRLSAIIEAFHLNFNYNDNAILLLKINKNGYNQNELIQEINNLNNKIKKDLRLCRYIDPIIITDYLTDNQIYGIHKIGHCYINSSFGEAWNLPMVDALGFNNYIISSDVVDFLPKEYVVSGQKVPCIGAEEYIKHLHSGKDNWENISILELGQKMKDIYNKKINKVKIDMSFISYEQVGENMYNNILEVL